VDHTAHQLQTRGNATVNLKEKAEALRQQARMLGLISPTSQAFPPMGRGRGQVPADLRAKLDSKPKQLLVMNVENRDELTAYFESFGGLMQVEMSQENPKNFIFTFRNNSVAQKVTLWIRT